MAGLEAVESEELLAVTDPESEDVLRAELLVVGGVLSGVAVVLALEAVLPQSLLAEAETVAPPLPATEETYWPWLDSPSGQGAATPGDEGACTTGVEPEVVGVTGACVVTVVATVVAVLAVVVTGDEVVAVVVGVVAVVVGVVAVVVGVVAVVVGVVVLETVPAGIVKPACDAT